MNNLHKQMIIEVCNKFNCQFNEIFCGRRLKNVVYAKKVIYWILRKEGLTYNQIARIVKKDHETVLVGIRSLPEELKGYASSIYLKYKRLYSLELKNNEAEHQRHKAMKVLNLLNKNHSMQEISDSMGEDVEPLIITYIEKKKIPNYQSGNYIYKYFIKNMQKNKKNY